MRIFALLAAALLLGLLVAGSAVSPDEIRKELDSAVEKKPGEAGAEAVFNKFGSNPWQGGDPWARIAPGSMASAGPLIPPQDRKYLPAGILNIVEALTLIDHAVCNQTGDICNASSMTFPAGSYRVYRVENQAGAYQGLWIELLNKTG
ncbi:MAG: hypothetical protein A4E45_00100 [Methanosaeta sp. PtaB.Bin039]|nr:MAG: hypothetical protein A4E45_00100 [Methanosaeta sp. PtaB.Bin039]OPY47567.1 MAG: hypothetical protein A4E47_00221 [Methanosaeta sp. PtaU1.Bin028]HOT06910.1 hypothetical protein [Methanotrichaceae archaeon]HQF16468.1 hypothetical protein [Methanotrichaceae archaeon]HQI91891.1 hypothetical protein [Methanotrichaceae archaeon]